MERSIDPVPNKSGGKHRGHLCLRAAIACVPSIWRFLGAAPTQWTRPHLGAKNAAKAAAEQRAPAAVVTLSAVSDAESAIDGRKLRGSPLRDKVPVISFGVTISGKMHAADLKGEPLPSCGRLAGSIARGGDNRAVCRRRTRQGVRAAQTGRAAPSVRARAMKRRRRFRKRNRQRLASHRRRLCKGV